MSRNVMADLIFAMLWPYPNRPKFSLIILTETQLLMKHIKTPDWWFGTFFHMDVGQNGRPRGPQMLV